MTKPSRRNFIGLAAAVSVSEAAFAMPQNVADAPPSSVSPRSYSMRLGVHMTNWQNLWRRGVMKWEDIARVTANLGFTGIQLQSDNVENLDQQGMKRIKDTMSSHGLKILAINVGNNFLAPDFDNQIKTVRDYAERCAYFEAPFERIYLGRKPAGMTDTQAFDQTRKGIEACLPFLEKLNVVAAPEPPDVFRAIYPEGQRPPVPAGNTPANQPPAPLPSGFEIVRDYPAGDITGIITLLRVVNSKYFRYMLDTGCIPPDEKYIWPHFLAPFTVGMHIKEWQFNWRTGEPIDTDYVRFLEPFKRAGFNGSLDLELRDPVRGGFDLGATVEEVSAKLKKMKFYMEKCIAA